jgi:hypothetical protein
MVGRIYFFMVYEKRVMTVLLMCIETRARSIQKKGVFNQKLLRNRGHL